MSRSCRPPHKGKYSIASIDTMSMKNGLANNLNNAPNAENAKKTQHKRYLTPAKLEKLLKEIPGSEWLGSEISVPGYPKRK